MGCAVGRHRGAATRQRGAQSERLSRDAALWVEARGADERGQQTFAAQPDRCMESSAWRVVKWKGKAETRMLRDVAVSGSKGGGSGKASLALAALTRELLDLTSEVVVVVARFRHCQCRDDDLRFSVLCVPPWSGRWMEGGAHTNCVQFSRFSFLFCPNRCLAFDAWLLRRSQGPRHGVPNGFGECKLHVAGTGIHLLLEGAGAGCAVQTWVRSGRCA